MNLLYLIANSLFFIMILKSILFWVSLWQVKEYRLDRMLIHLKETEQGRGLFFSLLMLIKVLLIFSFVIIIFEREFLLPYQILITILFLYLAVQTVQEVLSRFIKRPVFTVKAIIISIATLGVIILLLFIPLVDRFLWLLLLEGFVPFVVAIFVFLLSFPSEIVYDFQIGRAIRKIKKHKKLLVIGVTGSYGKSSTKDYIAQILGQKFNVLKTKGTNNTPIGIANTILHGLKRETQIFVVEMGAYKTGEVAQMCQMVHPSIGVLTAVNDQHLSLFGSLENTMKAKYELIDALPKDGLSLFNGNNENAALLYEQTEKKKILYRCLSKNKNRELEKIRNKVIAYNIAVKKESISFDILTNNKSIKMKAPLLGSHNIENILPAVYIARYLGMSYDEIQKAVSKLFPIPKTMIRKRLSLGITIINDTFNTNPQAVSAALNYMKIYNGKKILVLQPMIELGKNAKKEHFKIGREISLICDYLILTNRNYYSDILKGIKSADKKCEVRINNKNTTEFINEVLVKDDVIVFEGKESSLLLSNIL